MMFVQAFVVFSAVCATLAQSDEILDDPDVCATPAQSDEILDDPIALLQASFKAQVHEKSDRPKTQPIKARSTIAGKSIYFIVTDRFARSGDQAADFSACDLAAKADWRHDSLAGGRCNGTLQGIIDKVDYIKGMGFDCIWITPVVEAADYTGYGAINFFEIDSHIGSKATLKRLSRTLHENGMCLILDIVANHVRPMIASTNFTPQAVKTYLGPEGVYPFDKAEYFNTPRAGVRGTPDETFEAYVLHDPPQSGASAGNTTVLKQQVEAGLVSCGPENPELTECNCWPGNSGPHCPGSNRSLQLHGWFATLADLNQSDPFVRKHLLKYIRYLVDEYDVDAFRLDTAMYMPQDFLAELQNEAGVDILGEVTVNNLTYHAGFQQGVLNGVLNFPPFYKVAQGFCQYRMGGEFGNYDKQGTFTSEPPNLTALGLVIDHQLRLGQYSNLDLLGNFLDNHDEFSRMTYYCDSDKSRMKNALTWLMLTRGTPIIYYGTEQGLMGHQLDKETRTAYDKKNRSYMGQDSLRDSLWQSRYNTQTWQYSFIGLLNHVRKVQDISVGEQQIRFMSESQLIFTRSTPGAVGHDVWVFLNNIVNTSSAQPVTYCPGPSLSSGTESWLDVLSNTVVVFTNERCVVAKNADPLVIVQQSDVEVA